MPFNDCFRFLNPSKEVIWNGSVRTSHYFSLLIEDYTQILSSGYLESIASGLTFRLKKG